MGYWSDVDIARQERRVSAEAVAVRECPACQQRVAVPIHRQFTVCDRCRQAKEPSA